MQTELFPVTQASEPTPAPAPARPRRPRRAPRPVVQLRPDLEHLVALAVVDYLARTSRTPATPPAPTPPPTPARPAVVRSARGMGGKTRQIPTSPAVPVIPGAPLTGVRHWQTNKEILPGGKMRISCPQARGWAVVIRPNPTSLYAAELEARAEATKAGQAMWRGERYELDALTDADDPTEPPQRKLPDADELAARCERRDALRAGPKRVSYAKDAISRPDVANPADWSPNADGTWSSPKDGRRWGAHTKTVRRVLRKRVDMGLPVTYGEYIARQQLEDTTDETAEVPG